MAIRRTARRGGALEWLRRQLSRRPRPLWMVLTAHVLALGIALLLYALPHHVIPHGEASIGIVSTRGGAAAMSQAQPEPEPTEAAKPADAGEAAGAVEAQPTQAPTPEPTVDPKTVGNFREKFAGKFTSGEVRVTEDSYQSENLNIQVIKKYIEDLPAWVYVVDIYIADISCLQTAFGKDTYGRGYTEWVTKVAERYGSVVTMNGDYYGTRDTGVVIRNGMLYRDNKTTHDIAILYWDGHMETFSADAFDAKREMDRGAYQSWCFGPSLLDETGAPITSYNYAENVLRRNPRSAIGYYEPGHYCFLVVDGRSKESKGARMTQLANLMAGVGCTIGYNLDGGQTSLLAVGTTLYNHPSDGGRNSSDYIMIIDAVTE